MRAVSLMKRQRWRGGIALLNDNLRVVEKDWELSWNLAWCYFKLKRLEQARKHMICAAKLAPKSAACKAGLGVIYLEQKQFVKAQAYCAESLRIRDAYVPRLTLAFAYMKQGKIQQAEKVHLEGIRLKPKERRRYEAYADFLSDIGRRSEAQAMYRKAKEIGRAVFSNSR